MKILWLSNAALSEQDHGNTGTWLGAMAQELVRSGKVELGNMCLWDGKEVVRKDCGSISQWLLPGSGGLERDGLPNRRTIEAIINIIEEYSPDIIHIWGTEGFWGLITAREFAKHVALLETQGLRFAIAKVFPGGLTPQEQSACMGVKEFVKRTSIHKSQIIFEKWGIFEKEMISKHRFITVQTPWLEAQIMSVTSTAKIFHNDFMLREAFYTAQPWQPASNQNVFCTAAYSAPFKGLHVAIRAIAILKKQFPNINLRIAGAHQHSGLRRDGYVAWIDREVRRLGVEQNVTWLGTLSAPQIISELQTCAAILIPSFVEGYCLGLAEAMYLGVPSVVSYAGGTPHLAKDEESTLFFPPGDESMCAFQVKRMLVEPELAANISERSREIAKERNKSSRVVQNQIDIYEQILNSKEPVEKS